jgi:sugar phosphate permease
MLLFFGVSGMSGFVTATAVGNWFVLRRGNALGLATAGVSVAGVILPAAAHAIIQTSGLFYAFLWISVAIIAVAPLSFAAIRTRPEDYGLLPDGAVHESGVVYDEGPFHNREQSYSQNNVTVHWTLPMVVRNRSFWKIGVAYGLSMTSVLGVMFQLKPRFGDVGFDGDTAMKLMAATALVGAVGKYAWAYLCDKFPSRTVVTVLLLLNAVGLGIGIIHGSLAAVILFIVMYGFAMGGVVSTQPVIIAEFYGRDTYPTVARYIGIVVGIDCIGYPIMGMSFDLTGSYDSAYLVFIALNVIAAVVIGSLKRTERQ